MSEVLNCDAQGCDHVEPVGKITADMVGVPCPKCGANLLTEDDWRNWQPFSSFLSAINGIDGGEQDQKVSLRVGLHGSKTTIEIEPQREVDQ